MKSVKGHDSKNRRRNGLGRERTNNVIGGLFRGTKTGRVSDKIVL